MNKKLLLGALLGAGISLLNKKKRQQQVPQGDTPDFSQVPGPTGEGPAGPSLEDIFAKIGAPGGAGPAAGSTPAGDVFGGSVKPGAAPGGASGGFPGGAGPAAAAGGAGALFDLARRIFEQAQKQGNVKVVQGGNLQDILGQVFGGAAGKFGQQGPLGQQSKPDIWPDPAKSQPAQPTNAAAEEEKADVMLTAMVAAAQADGSIDEAEQQNIMGALQGQLDSGDLAELKRLLTSPVDVDQMVSRIQDPSTAFNVYMVSAMTIDEDNPREKQYMDQLAAKLGISDVAARMIEQQKNAMRV
ncbi:DUF533 domain-containing protein [Biformimicrobium ophioploci]|uniref:DUF533 domain-containing protein n=1 Tax=Biformimicrobium ophioploci TaxID=3036711 RepID=A0ABQ6LV46_9GAMM|nr:DUF533 domain-containing protein [Microbulbifer sp. NKW57]GMG85983.1 hypothetical protein MNKW57_03040 [Microbulbifer sp. NKW57]